jgi:hypothetical protein
MKLYNVVVHHYIMCDVPLIGPMVEQSRDSTCAENDAMIISLVKMLAPTQISYHNLCFITCNKT